MLAQCVLGVFLIIGQLELSKSSNILAFFPSPGRSHFKPFEPFFKALAYRGHNVTVVNAFPSHESIPGYHEIEFERKTVGSKHMIRMVKMVKNSDSFSTLFILFHNFEQLLAQPEVSFYN